MENKARVTIITDACRSGKLAGNTIGGSQLTSQNLAQQFANEIKILSCQPNEYSIEGEQWGGGRGAFSFHLIEGLFGMADANEDAAVSLMELSRYLEDHVTTEVAPESQVPMTVGNRTEKLAMVFPELLAAVQASKAGQLATFSPTVSRGLEEEILATVDTTIREQYQLFKQSIKDKVFLEPAEACADAYYERLIGEPKLKRLHNSMRRNYAAALQDDAQQVMNLYMKADFKEHVMINKTLSSDLTHRQLERAAALLGTGHYMYKTIKSRQYVYEAAYITFGDGKIPESTLAKAFALCRKSLEYGPDSPFPYFMMSLCYAETQRIDSVQLMIQQANRLAPLWVIPNLEAASVLSGHKNYEAAKLLLEQATSIDSTKAHVWAEWGLWYFSQQMYPEAAIAFNKVIVLDSTLAINWSNLGLIYITTERYEEAEAALKKALTIDSSMTLTWGRLGNLYRRTQRYAEAEVALKKAISLSPDWPVLLDMLGSVYNNTQRYSEAAPLFLQAIALDSTNMLYWSRLSYAYTQSQRYAEAEEALLKTLALDSTHVTSWNNLGFTYLHTQRYDAAEQALQKAIALNPELANSHKHLATVYLRLNRLDEAREGFQKSMATNPNYVGGYLGMAYLHTKEKEFDKALDYVKQAIQKGASYAMLSTDEDLADLRSNRKWEKMMRRYFPDQFKD